MGAQTTHRQTGTTARRRGRTWAVSLVGLYPLTLGFLTFVAPHIAHWPLPVRAAVFPLVLLTLMTFVVMPVLTRLMEHWLAAGGSRSDRRSPLLGGAPRKGGHAAGQNSEAEATDERACA
jgi:antibiotic biosynthesis monooxygenase (ABM) superfamily enzyme